MLLAGEPLTIATLLKTFLRRISVTWILTMCETALMALVPLFIGFAIDGLLSQDLTALYQLGLVFAALILVSVARRIYDTRIYGSIRVELGRELISKSGRISISRQNARLGMGRELVDFLEEEVPTLMDSVVQVIVSLGILFLFHPMLACAAMGSAVLMVTIYAAFHGRFYRLNADHNQQIENQVQVLEAKSPGDILVHLRKLRIIEIKLSDTEAYVYGAIFAVMTGFLIFNLWFAATNLTTTTGTIFSIITYSWEFVESALVLPATLQGWSRLSEIMVRINSTN